MENQKVDVNAILNATSKVNVGVRVEPEMKFLLLEESEKMGLSLSEYVENIFMHRHEKNSNLNNLQIELADAKKLISKKDIDLNEAIKKLVVADEIITDLRGQVKVYKNPALLALFESLKGKSDTIIDSAGNSIKIQYNSLQELLEAIIYSFKLKQPC